jgi:SAM-dependent methyltransferase
MHDARNVREPQPRRSRAWSGSRAELLRSIQEAVRFALPYWASVVVINRGDPDVLGVLDRERHGRSEFPQGDHRPGDAPRDAGRLIDELERLRDEGWDYILVPATAFEWLDERPEFGQYLETEYRSVLDEPACVLFRLETPGVESDSPAGDGLPLPPPELVGLVVGPMDPELFFESGASTASWIAAMIGENGRAVEQLERMLDFGCGCGRVLRHWPGATGASLYGTDYNPRLIEWCRANLPFADFEVNRSGPPLPLAKGGFDLIYGLSVLTHLGEPLQLSWMREFKRLLKPDGLLILTLHGRRFADWLDPDEAERFASGNVVVRGAELSGSDFCATFHPEQYVRDVLGRGFEVLEYSEAPARDVHQDVVLFLKR